MLETFKRLSDIIGPDRIGWRYDPIIIDQTWPVERHINAFNYMAGELSGYTHTAVISFIDLYEKTKRNYPTVSRVKREDRITLGRAMIGIGQESEMTIRPCAEGDELAAYGADCSGCMTISM